MASTNKTSNYDLSQYVANDKPTYLVDYNSDMNKIDTQMKANNDLAVLAKTASDDLSSRIDGQDVIIGNLNSTVGQHTTDISSLNTDVTNINTKVGNLSNLNTTDKTDVVSAINEVNTKAGDLTNLNTSNKSDVVSAINEVNTKVGNLSNLNTTDKSDVVNAINEVKNLIQDVYSRNEVKTNKVDVDGKPIYRKCIVASAIDFYGNTSQNIPHNISNLLRVTDIKYSMFFPSENVWYIEWDKIISKTANDTYIKLTTSSLTNYVRFTNVEVIIEYTKTTD